MFTGEEERARSELTRCLSAARKLAVGGALPIGDFRSSLVGKPSGPMRAIAGTARH
jgi:hypothetical protein